MISGSLAVYATTLVDPPPVTSAVDANGVDLGTGIFTFSVTEVVIGQPGAGGLVYARNFIGQGWRDNLTGTINASGATYTVSAGGSSDTFTLASGAFTSDQENGSTLTYDSRQVSAAKPGGGCNRSPTSLAPASCATKNPRSKIGLATALVVRRASQEDDRGAQ